MFFGKPIRRFTTIGTGESQREVTINKTVRGGCRPPHYCGARWHLD